MDPFVGNAVSFSSGEIVFIVGAMLAAVCGALALVFRMLLRSEQAKVELLTTAKDAEVDLLRTVVTQNTAAVAEFTRTQMAQTAAIQDLQKALVDHSTREGLEHKLLMDTMRQLTATTERRTP